MLKKISKNIKYIRFVFFFSLTVIMYIFSIIYLFGFHNILGSIVFILICFMAFHFLFIDIKNLELKHFIWIIVVLILLEIGIFVILRWKINIWIMLSLITYNSSLVALFYSLEMVDFSSISYFTRGGYIFTLFISIMYSIAFVGMFQEFPFTCQGLNEASNKLFNFIEKPFIPNKKFKDPTNTMQIEIQHQMDYIAKIQGFKPKIDEFGIGLNLDKEKTNVIDQILADKSEYSDGVCDLLLREINGILEKDGLKSSVILLSYLLLYGFIRIAFFVASGFAFLLFKLLYLCRVYKISKVSKIVDEIY